MSAESRGSRVVLLSVWGIVLVVAALITALAVFKPTEPEVDATEEKPVPVATRTLVAQTVPDVLRLPGRVEADADVTLSAEKGGRVREIRVDKGDRVSKGDALLHLDDRVWGAILSRAEVELADAKKEEERWQKLKETGAVSDSEYDRIKRRLNMAAASAEEARVHVSQCCVLSPVNGVIDGRYVDTGEYVVEGQAVLRVVDRDRLKVVVHVPEREVVHVREDMVIPFDVPVVDGATFTGRVSFVATAAMPGQSSFETEILVENPDVRVLPGMLVDVAIARREWRDALVVPINAVVPKKGHHSVFLVRGNRVEARVVQIERFLGDSVVISSGLAEGDEVVVEGQRTLQDGMLVTVLSE